MHLKLLSWQNSWQLTYWKKNKDLHFELLSLHFIELVRCKRCTEALEFAQKNLSPFGKVQTYVKKLEDLMALLAYEEPEKSPMFHLFSLDRRQLVADDLNRAILAHMNQPRYSSLERLIQQTTAVDRQLNQEHGKEGQSSFSLEEFVKKKNRTNTPEIPSKGQKQDAWTSTSELFRRVLMGLLFSGYQRKPSRRWICPLWMLLFLESAFSGWKEAAKMHCTACTFIERRISSDSIAFQV